MKAMLATLALSINFITLGCQAPKETVTPSRRELVPAKIDSKEVAANYYRVGECYLAGQPTERGFAEAKLKGVKTVLNLREEGEFKDFDEKKVIESLSLRYLHLPVPAQNISDKTVDRFLASLNTAPKPILIHCGSAGRVSGLWAIHLVVDEGLSVDEAIALGEQSGLKKESLKTFVRGYLERRQKR